MMLWDGTTCDFQGGKCLTRAKLHRDCLELQAAIRRAPTERSARVAEKRYHRALTAWNEHVCTPAGDEDRGGREAGAGGSATPAGLLAELDAMVDRCEDLYHRGLHAPDIRAEHKSVRLALRTKHAMLVAHQHRRLIDFLEEAERGAE